MRLKDIMYEWSSKQLINVLVDSDNKDERQLKKCLNAFFLPLRADKANNDEEVEEDCSVSQSKKPGIVYICHRDSDENLLRYNLTT